MDFVLKQFDMRSSPDHVYTQRGKPMFGGAQVANFKTLDSHVTLVLNREYSGSARGSEVRCVEHRRFARKASKSDKSIARVAGCVDAHQFFVDAGSNADRASCPSGVCGVLYGAPRLRLSARIRITPSRRHVEGGVGLAKRRENASK